MLETHKVGNNGIKPILLSYIRICLHYLYLEMLVNEKLDVSWQKGKPFKVQTSLVFLILNGMAKAKMAILPFFCCGEIVKNSFGA